MSASVSRFRFHDLEEGDVVALLSGGPFMLVAVADGEVQRQVECIWVSGERGERRLQTESMDARVLKVVARRPVWRDDEGWSNGP